MKLVTFGAGRGSHVGAIVGERVVDLSAAGIADSMLNLIRAGKSGLAKARRAVKEAGGKGKRLADLQLLAPIEHPGKVLCSGINYKGHADENPDAKMPTYPHFFAKVSTAIANPEDEIKLPAMTRQMDYEVEFAVVIGRR